MTSGPDTPEDGRQRAFLDATLPHLDAIGVIARHLSADPHRAEDLVQETFLRAFAAYDTHRGEHTKAWLATICLNVARDDARRRTRRVVETSMPTAYDAPANGRGAADQALAHLDRETIAQALAQLPHEQRVAIVLMDIVGHSAQEAGDIMGSPRNTVLSRVHRGRRRLAQLLELSEVDRGLP